MHDDILGVVLSALPLLCHPARSFLSALGISGWEGRFPRHTTFFTCTMITVFTDKLKQ